MALTALFVFPASLPAAADPPLTAAEARRLIKQLETDAAAIDQQYAGVKEQIKQGRAQLKLKQADAQAQIDKVARMKLQVGQVALAQFQNRSLDTAAQLFVTPDTERFLSQISTVQKVSENQNSALQDFQQAQAELAALEHAAKADLAALAEKEKQLKSLTDASDKKLAEAKKVLAKLTAEQRQQISEAEKRATARANAAGRQTSREASRAPVTGSGRGAKALAYARAQLGEPYVRNGAGPSSWDCSGLTMKAWGSVGVSLPHSSGSSTTASDMLRSRISSWAIWCSSTTTSTTWASTPVMGKSSTPRGPASRWSTSRCPTCLIAEPAGQAEFRATHGSVHAYPAYVSACPRLNRAVRGLSLAALMLIVLGCSAPAVTPALRRPRQDRRRLKLPTRLGPSDR